MITRNVVRPILRSAGGKMAYTEVLYNKTSSYNILGLHLVKASFTTSRSNRTSGSTPKKGQEPIDTFNKEYIKTTTKDLSKTAVPYAQLLSDLRDITNSIKDIYNLKRSIAEKENKQQELKLKIEQAQNTITKIQNFLGNPKWTQVLLEWALLSPKTKKYNAHQKELDDLLQELQTLQQELYTNLVMGTINLILPDMASTMLAAGNLNTLLREAIKQLINKINEWIKK